MANNINLYQTEADYQAAIANGNYVEPWVSLSKDTNTVHYNYVPNAVDLGLPSGTLWADTNLGAFAPEQFGDYYAWGETETYYSRLNPSPAQWKDGKSAGYAYASYKYGSDGSSLTKYNSTDGLTQLELLDDAAHADLGGDWRIPTEAQWTELINNCTWTRSSYAYNVTGPNGNSIFLPGAGYYNGVGFNGLTARYWSSNSSGTNAKALRFSDSSSGSIMIYARYLGLSIRPVK